MQNQPASAEDPTQMCRQGRCHLAELGEDQHLLLAGGDHLGDLAQAGPLAAVRLGPLAIVEPLRGVIADLLQAHQCRQHDALAPDAIGILQGFGQTRHRLGIEGSLLAA